MRTAAFALLGLFAICSLAAAAPTLPPAGSIKADHPRLLIRAKATPNAISLDQLKKIERDADFNKMLDHLKRQKTAAPLALAYLLTGDKADADAAIAIMRTWKPTDDKQVLGNPFDVCYPLTDMALAYDWLHDYPGLTAEIKASVRAATAPLAEAGFKGGADHVFHNYTWMKNSGALLWALAAAGDDPAMDKILAGLVERLNDKLYPAMEYLDGMAGEAMGYWFIRDIGPCVMSVMAAQSAFDAPICDSIKKDHHDWFSRQLDHLVLGTMPDTRYIPWGDIQEGPDAGVSHEMACYIDAMTWTTNSSRGAFLSNWLAGKRGLARFYGETAMYYFIYARTMKVAPADPPLAGTVGGAKDGQFFARSDWTDAATMVGFRCCDYYGNHNHFDQGSFQIYRNGLLAVDAGVYKNVSGQQQNTDAHNTLLFGGKGQRHLNAQGSMSVEEFTARLKPGSGSLETGDMLFFKDTPAWSAVAGQFAQAYDPDVVASCVRQLLFIRPGMVAVVDQLAAPVGKSLPEVSWLLNVQSDPKIAEGAATADNGKSWIRSRRLLGEPSTLAAAKSYKAVVGEKRVVDTYRITFTYAGQPTMVLVHLLETGDGTTPAAPIEAQARNAGQTVELSVGGKTYTFSTKAPFEVGAKGN